MKFRQGKPIQTDTTESEIVEGIRRIDRETFPPRSGLPDAYWQNLLIRTNARIDEVSSPRAIGLSWLMRVAVPGVFAILSFVVALHYYVPMHAVRDNGIAQALKALPETSIDSLMVEGAGNGDTGPVPELSSAAFRVSGEQIEDYFIENGKENQIVETMDDRQVHVFLDALTDR